MTDINIDNYAVADMSDAQRLSMIEQLEDMLEDLRNPKGVTKRKDMVKGEEQRGMVLLYTEGVVIENGDVMPYMSSIGMFGAGVLVAANLINSAEEIGKIMPKLLTEMSPREMMGTIQSLSEMGKS